MTVESFNLTWLTVVASIIVADRRAIDLCDALDSDEDARQKDDAEENDACCEKVEHLSSFYEGSLKCALNGTLRLFSVRDYKIALRCSVGVYKMRLRIGPVRLGNSTSRERD